MLLLGIPNEILPEAGQHGLQASRRPSVFIWPVSVFYGRPKSTWPFPYYFLDPGNPPQSQPDPKCFLAGHQMCFSGRPEKQIRMAKHVYMYIYVDDK